MRAVVLCVLVASAAAAPAAPAQVSTVWPVVQLGLLTADDALSDVAAIVTAGTELLPPAPAAPPVEAGDVPQTAQNAVPLAVTVAPASGLPRLARTGRLLVRVAASTPSVVAVDALVRPAGGRRAETDPAGLVFRLAGDAVVSLEVPAATQRALRRARTARVAIRATAADVAQQRVRVVVRRTLRR